MSSKKSSKRFELLDTIRGLTLLSMIAFHTSWDLVYMYGIDWPWYRSEGAYVWQQSICWTFILLSGFCWSMGQHRWRRGLMVFGGGLIVTLVTCFFMWEDRVIFGVLTMLGSCMLLMIPLDKPLRKLKPWLGFAISAVLFVVTRNINGGYLGFESWQLLKLPAWLYQNYVTTYFGFVHPGFYSTDYFSLFPWFFLFLCGYFFYHMMAEEKSRKLKDGKLWHIRIPGIDFIGKHSLWIYMAHQPVVFAILQTIFHK